VARWICPECEREFGRARQSHVCVPGGTVDDTFRGREWQRPICDEIIAFVEELGPLHVDAVGVGVFLKRERKLAEIRPMVRALSVLLWLPRVLDDPRVLRRYDTWHVIRLTDPAQVDEQLKDWLTEAYDNAG
jgi:DNA-binding Lrp family transcriptional regulator